VLASVQPSFVRIAYECPEHTNGELEKHRVSHLNARSNCLLFGGGSGRLHTQLNSASTAKIPLKRRREVDIRECLLNKCRIRDEIA
jgi:hypothetical protein